MKPIEILRACYPARREIIPCLLGEPGIGKTQCVYQLGKELGVKVHMMNMNGKTPNEVVGMAMPDNEHGTMEVFDYGILSKAKDGDIVIIDEMLTSAPSCLNAILTLAESRILPSGRRIADVMIVAAANPLTSPDRISLAVRDRFQFIEVKFNKSDWRRYINDRFGIMLNDSIVNGVQVSGREYNVPTPRTMTKYIWWLSDICKTKEDRIKVYEVIEEVFDSGMAMNFRKQFECKPKSEQMFDALYDVGIRFNNQIPEMTYIEYRSDDGISETSAINKNLIDIDVSDILESLMKMDLWEEINKKLSKIDME